MRIKILFLIENLIGGGAEKVLCDLVNHMDQDAFEITVQTLWKADAEKFLRPGIRYRYCYASQSRVNSWRSRAEIALGLCYRLHIKDDYDIEVAYLECGATKILAGSTNKQAKKVAWVHCDLALKMSDPEAFVQKAAKWYEKFDRVICVSQNVKDSFDQLFGISEKTTVLYNTVDDVDIRRKAEAFLPDIPKKRRLTIVSVGRLSPEKGFDRLLRVHKALLDSGLIHDLWIVGEGNQRGTLEKTISEDNLYCSVRLFGYQQNPYPIMKEADLLVCPSFFEGFSTFVTEGLILGKPIVTTACSGMRELLGESEFGLITENSSEGLLEGMRRILKDEALRAAYADRALTRGKDFSARKLAQMTEDYLFDLIRD